MNYTHGISLESTCTKQIKCKMKNSNVMKLISFLLIGMLLSAPLFSQYSYDTTYSKEWNSKTESWVYFDRIISTFSNMSIQSEVIQIYENDNWVNYNQKSYFYNNGSVIEEREYYWNQASGEWFDNYRKLYSYNDNNLVSSIKHQYIFNGNYVNSSREIFNYDENNHLIEKIVETYEEAWTNFLKYQYYYNAVDLILEENLTYWRQNEWGDAEFTVTYAYNKDNQIIEKQKSKFENQKKQEQILEKFVYDIDGKLAEQTIAQWNSKTNNWVDKNRAEYLNDMDGYIISMLNQNKNKKEWVNYLFTEFKGNNEPLTSLDITGGMTFSIYPVNYGKRAVIEFENPYNEEYFVKIMDKNGNLMGSATTNKDEVTLDAKYLYKGLYFVELQGRHLYSGLFSVE